MNKLKIDKIETTKQNNNKLDRLKDLVAKDTRELALSIDKESFVSISNALNGVGMKYGFYANPEDVENIFKKGLLFDSFVEEKGFDSAYGLKTHFAIDREKTKRDLELYKKAFYKVVGTLSCYENYCDMHPEELANMFLTESRKELKNDTYGKMG